MSDPSPTAPGAGDPAPAPIEVPVKAWPALTNEGLRVIVLGVCAVAADRFIRHDALIPAVMAGAGFVATWAVGAYQHVRAVGLFKALNELLPDTVVKAKS